MRNTEIRKILITAIGLLMIANGSSVVLNSNCDAMVVRGDGNTDFIANSHLATKDDIDAMRELIGVYDPEVNYNVLYDGLGTGFAPLTKDEWDSLIGEIRIVESSQIPATKDSAFDLSADPCFPQVRSQGSQGSCSAWAATYYANGFVQAKNNDWTGASSGNNNQLLSPAFTYNKCNHGYDHGSWAGNNAKVAQRVGVSRWVEMPYSSGDYVGWGDEDAWRDAPMYRIDNRYFLYPYYNDADINTIKAAIDSYMPVAIAIDADCYYNFGSDNVLGSNAMPSDINHANTIVGYDNSKTDAETGETGAFKIVNSWGQLWGPNNNGYYWMTYQAFKGSWNTASVCWFDDQYIIPAHPKLIGTWTLDPQCDRDASVSLGIGPYGSPLDTRSPWWDGHSAVMHPYPEFMCLDITEFYDEWDAGNSDFYLYIGNAYGNDGTITSFNVEFYDEEYDPDNPTEISLESPDTPENTPGYVTVWISIDDVTSPTISDVLSTPLYQLPSHNVNISCFVTDNREVENVKVHITYPDKSTVINVSMDKETSDSYYYEESYSSLGAYDYYIWAVDTSGNEQTSEMYFFEITTNLPGYEPYNPLPDNQAIAVLPDVTLSWDGGDPDGDPILYDIYFGDTNPPTKIVSNQSSTTYNIGTLDRYTNYYWQIISWDDQDRKMTSPLWTFRTISENTMTIENTIIIPGQTDLTIPIYGEWDRTISGYSIGLQYPLDAVEIVDIDNTGTIGEDAFVFQYIEPTPGVISLGVAWMPDFYKPQGSGLIANLIVNINEDITPDDYIIDLGVFGGNPPIECLYSDETSIAFYPEVVDGALTIGSGEYDCADINNDGTGPDITDLVYLVDYMFQGGLEPPIMCQADIDSNGAGPDIADLVYLVDYMFQGGPLIPDTCCD